MVPRTAREPKYRKNIPHEDMIITGNVTQSTFKYLGNRFVVSFANPCLAGVCLLSKTSPNMHSVIMKRKHCIFPQPSGWVSVGHMRKSRDGWIDSLITYRSKLHLFQGKTARGSGTSHRNPQIRIERNRLGAPKKIYGASWNRF
mgnify:CR=1 FL=1